MMVMRPLMIGMLAATVGAMGLGAARYRSEIRAAHERVDGRSIVLPSPYGDIEFYRGGSGPDVLIVHGAGGGFDHGELIAQIVLGDDFAWLAPSRFGYLRSTLPDGANHEDQAHAYGYLLDQLGIETVAVVALSAGGSSALLFAALYPERVTSLTLLSAGVAPLTTEDQARAHRKGTMLARVFQNDVLYWGVTTLFRKQTMGLMGVDRDVVAGLTPEQQALANRLIEGMLPVSRRSAGASFDNINPPPGERIAAIRVPTLIVHAEDDALQLFDNAAFAAAHIPDASLLSFERGGHFVAITEQATVRRAVLAHIRSHTRGAMRQGEPSR
jgi:2-hydroxy-6-oxonona-2,4-dienedioate hydrolase